MEQPRQTEPALLKQALEKIELSPDARARIVQNCAAGVQSTDTPKRRARSGCRLRRPVAVAIALSLCLCLGVGAAAAMQTGFFRDVTNLFGAVVGTTYEQATDEIDVRAEVDAHALRVRAELLAPDVAPYREIETLAVGGYHIEDADGRTVAQGTVDEAQPLTDDAAEFTIPLDDLAGGGYTLFIDEFTGGAKADQPLPIHGTWRCDFTV